MPWPKVEPKVRVPDDVRAQIMNCTDADRLEAWALRATTATSVDQVFD
jgi:hypothetical protein